MYHSHNPFAGTTGKQFEQEFFGECRLVTWQGEYVRYAVAMSMARQHQPADVLHESGRQLRDKVAAKLGCPVEMVKFFTALGTPLDRYHGVDAFIETTLFPGITVTVDLTLSAKGGYKSNVIVNGDDALLGFENAADAIISAFRRPRLSAR